MNSQSCSATPSTEADRLPMSGLLALAAAGFITILTEALPAGLLPQMSSDLGVTQALVGQLITAYALGSLLAAIPLTLLTQGWRRRPLLLCAVAGFALVNAVTALSSHYWLTLIARFLAGVFAGLLWALLAGYASRMVASHLQGRAIAIAMLGAPLALSLGIPLGTFLGSTFGWRLSFALMTGLTLLLVGWVRWQVPDFAGQTAKQRPSLLHVAALPGVQAVLLVTFLYVLGHNVLYTYIAPFLVPADLVERVDQVLLVFGLAALLGIWGTGLLIDRWLRQLTLISCALFAASAIALGLWTTSAVSIYVSVAVWGLSFGGLPALLQTALAKTAGQAADIAQSMLVTVWNLAIAGGAMSGALALSTLGVQALPWMVVGLLAVALMTAAQARRSGFPVRN